MSDIFPIIYITTSIVSIILAITAIWFSLSVEKRLKMNFLKLKDLIELQHDRTQELMNNMHGESKNIQKVVYKTQADIHETLEKMQKNCEISDLKDYFKK
ncbi:hypothetical protein [Methanobacterium alcaliphilum]|uniref:hypothetical protein n=1 Tax=Methanobacterium alcaliphilum TaxID=392018 RepID=UPI00200B0526|nr:hypothetical protein [Methanobacterium alcaliphilum]MCK9151482.1 hypothetical protein [Methanobacterium alcaliphilum]